MIKEEKLTYSIAKKRVRDNLKRLLNSNQTMEDIFNISFCQENFTIFNLVKHNALTEITYGEAKNKVKYFASFFKNEIPSSEKHVGLLLDNCPEWIYSMYGLLMAGFKPILLSTASSKQENEQILKDLNASYVVTNKDINANKLNPFEMTIYEEKNANIWENEVIFVTSGTSGKPKIISYSGKELSKQIVNAAGILRKYPLIASTYNGYLKHLLILPLYHVFGFIAVFLWFSFFNITFVIPSDLAPEHIREACLIGEPTHIFAVPLFWDTIVKKIDRVVKEKQAEKKFNKALDISICVQKIFRKTGSTKVKNLLFSSYLENIFGKSIQFCITGGSSISKRTLKVINALGYPLVNGYGSTEIGISSFSNPKTIKGRMSDSIGKPFDYIEYKVSETNELIVRGESTYKAIFNSGKWEYKSKDDFVNTNDVASLIDGNYYLFGRSDEMVIDSNGENYSLASIEQQFTPLFADDIVALQEKDKSIALLLAFRESVLNYEITNEISNLINSKLLVINKIKNIYIYKKPIPKANGLKVKRNLLTEMLINNEFKKININDYQKESVSFEINQSILEEVINKFSHITGSNNITADTDFFNDLGGESLTYYELISSIENHFGVKLNIESKIYRTPKQFALEIMEKTNL